MGAKSRNRSSKTKGNQPKPEPEVAAAKEEEPKKLYSLVLVKDPPNIVIPELYWEIYFADIHAADGFAEMFGRARCKKTDDLSKADLVVFSGGPDVQPSLYGEPKTHKLTNVDQARDDVDMNVYARAYQAGIPMVGICRGAQFLHVMNNGALWQHVDGHVGDHSITSVDGEVIDVVSSTHHQMCIKNDKMEVLATANKATEKWRHDSSVYRSNVHDDIEAFFYRDTCCLGFQGHPEYRGYDKYREWVLKAIQSCIQHSPDLEYDGKNMRLKREFILERETPNTK